MAAGRTEGSAGRNFRGASNSPDIPPGARATSKDVNQAARTADGLMGFGPRTGCDRRVNAGDRGSRVIPSDIGQA